MSDALRRLIQKVGGAVDGHRARNLSRREAELGFEQLLDGEGSVAQVAAFFVALRAKGPTCDELAGFAGAARRRIAFPPLPERTVVLCTSRLGKFHSPPIGVAAVAAAAASGVPVLVQAAPAARGAGITLGDVWQRMVGPAATSASDVGDALVRHGLACWQPTAADGGWQRLLDIENEVGLRATPDTVSKLLAPEGCRLLVSALSGPVLGVASDAIAALGHDAAMIVQGVEGSVEPSVRAETRGMMHEDGWKSPLRLRPADLGLASEHEPQQMHEDRLEAAVGACYEALTSTPGAAYHAATLCAALLVRLAGATRDLATASGMAREALDSGAAHRVLQGLAPS